MLLANNEVLLSRLPREHFTRPAIDPLFRSAARAFGRRVVGVVLIGNGSDGAVGLQDIKNAGGIVVVQDPSNLQFREMPETALRTVPADYVVDSAALGNLLVDLPDSSVAEIAKPFLTKGRETGIEMNMEAPHALTCPDAVERYERSMVLAFCHIVVIPDIASALTSCSSISLMTLSVL